MSISTIHYVRCLFGALFCTLLSIIPTQATPSEEAGNDCVLIVSSYNPDARRMSNFISDFEKTLVQRKLPCNIVVETLDCNGMEDASRWMSQVDQMINRYQTRRLRAVVFLGQEAWASFISLGKSLPDVLCFGCFVSSNGIMLPAPTGAEMKDWLPESIDYRADAAKQPMVGGLLNCYDVRGNIELIRSLYPNVENIAFVSDNTYGGISLQALVRKEMQAFPDLNLVLIDSRHGEHAAHQLYAALPPQSAVLLGTWRTGSDGEYLIQRSLNDLVHTNPRIPVFSLTGSGIGTVAVGGLIPRYQNGASFIGDELSQFYQKGKHEAVRFELCDNFYKFDSRILEALRIPEYSLPKGSEVEDTLAVKLSKYSSYIEMLIVGIALLVILLCFVGWLFVRTSRLKRTLEEREGQLVIARERAVESDMLKSAFLANMSHEIRTPLNAIVGFSSLMQDEELSQEERAEYCSIVVSNSEMLLTLLNDILDISSLECGKIKFKYASEDIVQICQHALLTTAHTRQPQVEAHFECPMTSYMLMTDIHRLTQVLINLLTNAGKYTESGSITLAVRIDEEHQEAIFSVTDTGVGIPLEKQNMVFNRFEKIDGKKQGTGLGLAICRQIATIVGGRIYVDPTYTGGARFVFVHPIGLHTNDSDASRAPMTV